MTKPGYMLIQGDASRIPLQDKSVNCVVTSPPYYKLRRNSDDPNELGQESTPEEYANRLCGIFREVKRVLRDDASLCLNIGDSYANKMPRRKGFSPKNRLGVPGKVADAFQKDGWIWRDEIVWHKVDALPTPANDRTVAAHELVLVFSKKPRYYWDSEAIKEPTADGSRTKGSRSVWSIPKSSFKGKHFSVMANRLAAKLIKAGSSEHGACSECGAPWKRQVSKTRIYRDRPHQLTKRTGEVGTGNFCANHIAGTATETIGWKPSCKCDADIVPSTVLDPFGGSGTTVAESNRLGRTGIMMDLNADYLKLAEDRIKKARIKAGLDVDAERYPLIAEIERRREAS